MDLSRSQKTRRDAVEDPLFLVEQLLDELEQCHTRINATMQVWPETRRTLQPAARLLDERQQQSAVARLKQLQSKLALLWKHGAATLWKVTPGRRAR